MSLKLFEHNQSAFISVLEMLNVTGKAAVIHPTGTGKSYIGFKLCEEFPDKTVCWLSPSEYIFDTQIENLKKNSDGWLPDNMSSDGQYHMGARGNGLWAQAMLDFAQEQYEAGMWSPVVKTE